MSDEKSNVVWPERFRVEPMPDDEAEKLARQIAEWDASISDQAHMKHILQKLKRITAR